LLPGRPSPLDTFGRNSAASNGPKLCDLCSFCTASALFGLAFLVPGVVSPDLPSAFAHSAAYGDIIAATLALLSLLSLSSGAGVVIAWIFNLWGSADLLNAFYQANHAGLLAGQLGSTYFIPTLVVPLLLITHGLAFRILLQHENESEMLKADR
jgi:hypothetical protein